MTEAEIRLLWEYTATAWRTFTVDPTPEGQRLMLMVWSDFLGDLDAGLVRRALVDLGATGWSGSRSRDWPPPLGLVRERAQTLGRAADGIVDPPAPDEAWEQVWRAAVSWTQYADDDGDWWEGQWSHPLLAEAVAAFGWASMRDARPEQVPTVRAQFRDHYTARLTRWHRETNPPPPPVAELLAQGQMRQLGAGR